MLVTALIWIKFELLSKVIVAVVATTIPLFIVKLKLPEKTTFAVPDTETDHAVTSAAAV